jgi:tetratricopeptide (TPR) repeat protein
MSTEEDTFNQNFTAILQNPKSVSDPQKQQFYDFGVQFVRQIPDDDPDAREAVLQKLMIIFPQNSELLYLMGYTWLNHNFFKSLSWFQLCFTANPNDAENILSLTKLLFDGRYYEFIKYINDTHQKILESSKDPRLLLLIATLLIKDKHFIEAEKVFGHIFGSNKQDQTAAPDSGFMSTIYLNLAFTLQQKMEIEKALQYTQKSLGFCANN